MSRIVVFGAGGRAGRRVVAEAARRGHEVTAVVRTPDRHPDLAGEWARNPGRHPEPAGEQVREPGRHPEPDGGQVRESSWRPEPGVERVRVTGRYPDVDGGRVRVVAGDVTDAGSVAEAAAGHDVAVQVAARLDVPARDFFPAAARALVDGLAGAGVSRLVALGIGSLLEVAPGVRLVDTPGFPADARTFSLGHAAELEVFEGSALDWVVIAPPPVILDAESPGTGRYRVGGNRVPAEGGAAFSYADVARAIVDEAERPAHHRVQVAVFT